MVRSKRFVIGIAVAIAAASLVVTVAFGQRYSGYTGRPGQNYGGLNDSSLTGQKWEFASLRFRLIETKWFWRSPSETCIGDKQEIYRKLGGVQRHGGDMWYGEILNAAGQQGWEVVTVLEREQGTEVWFKRPAR